MIYRKQTRALYQATSIATLAEVTEKTQRVNPSSLTFAMQTTGFLYLGYADRFCCRYFDLSTVSSTSSVTVAVQYWNGSTWSSVQDLQDQTLGFTQSGFIAWQNESDWAAQELSPVTDVNLYWIRISVSSNLVASVLTSVLNLFCDANLLREYYPELVYDTRFLPPGRTTFVEQFDAARHLIVQKLIQKSFIRSESEILDINEVAVAAVHAAAWIIYNPNAGSSEVMQKKRDDAWDAMVKELDGMNISPDADNSGTIDEVVEDNVPDTFIPRW